MIRSSFRFERPESLDEAVRLLAHAEGRGRVLGGGSMLIPALSMGQDDPSLVLDPGRLSLGGIRATGDEVTIGASATYAALAASEPVQTRLPLLAAMVAGVTGGPGLWNLATLGGAVCYGNPAADAPGCLVALGAGFRLASVEGSRLVPAHRFFHGPFVTDRRPDEILTEIVVPAPSPGRSAYFKLKHAASSWPIVTASCLVAGGDEPRLRLCLGGAAPVPALLDWPYPAALDENAIKRMTGEAAAAITTEWADELAGPGYRRAVAATMAARALRAVSGMPR